jgi:hypothetical protein
VGELGSGKQEAELRPLAFGLAGQAGLIAQGLGARGGDVRGLQGEALPARSHKVQDAVLVDDDVDEPAPPPPQLCVQVSENQFVRELGEQRSGDSDQAGHALQRTAVEQQGLGSRQADRDADELPAPTFADDAVDQRVASREKPDARRG